MKNWTSNNIPDQSGKIAVITGGNIGLGYEIAYQLAKKNATIVIACRTPSKGEAAVKKIEQALGSSIHADVIQLDLTSMESIHAFVDTYEKKYSKLDMLINNAGVVNLIEWTTTLSGLEMHMATNHFGHFALTGLLFDTIINTPNSRVVTMSSGAANSGDIQFDDLNWEKRAYSRSKSYGDSKLANQLFSRSLQERFDQLEVNTLSVSAHPGLSATERQQTIGIGGWLSKVLAQPVWKGALPALRAATDPAVKPMEYYGPKYGLAGYPTLASVAKRAYDKDLADKLWTVSEEITQVRF